MKMSFREIAQSVAPLAFGSVTGVFLIVLCRMYRRGTVVGLWADIVGDIPFFGIMTIPILIVAYYCVRNAAKQSSRTDSTEPLHKCRK